jgi:ABC-type protease/lipase transport system fused ATPase/permease subunit
VLGVLGSGLITFLQLAASLYSLAVHDHALARGDAGALLLLTCLAVGLHGFCAALDFARGRVLARAGLHFARRLEGRALFLLRDDRKQGVAALGDADRVAHFLAGAGPGALLDALWLPVSLVAIALLHPVLALFAVAAAVLMVCIAIRAERRVATAGLGILDVRRRRFALGCGARPSEEVMRDWRRSAVSRSYYRQRGAIVEASLAGGAVARGVRLAVQSLGFGLGALLVLANALTVGQLFAWSLIGNRVFGSVDAALSQWRGLAAARDSFLRLAALEARHTGPVAGAQILNSSMLAKAVRRASDQAPESFLKYSSSWKMRFSRRASRLSRS